MLDIDLLANRAVVFGSALVYWAGVFVQARRIRRHIGRSPNVKPRGAKERLLWAGWSLVVAAWLAVPFLARTEASSPLLGIIPALIGRVGFLLGTALVAAGYAGTLWSYAAMGNAWRMGVNRGEKTPLVKAGPFRFVRHPIYSLQAVMLAGMVLLLPALISFLVLAVHILCIFAKAADEENYLRAVHGTEYAGYLSRSGRFLPKLRLKPRA